MRRSEITVGSICFTAVVVVVVARAASDGSTIPRAAPQGGGRLILVTGATGRQGGAAARRLLERGFLVRALTRNPDQPAAHELRQLGATIAVGDFDAPVTIDSALRGVYGVFSVQTYWGHGYDGEVRQGRTLADRAKAAGVQHFVYSSVASANRATGIAHFESKWAIEEHIRAIGIPYTILRPVAFMENWESERDRILTTGVLRTPLAPETHLQQIAVDDIGSFVALALERPTEWLGRSVDVAGDDLTMSQIAATVGRIAGKPVRYEQVPWSEFEATSDKDIARMYRWFEAVGYSVDLSKLRALHPFLSTFANYLRARRWTLSSGARCGKEQAGVSGCGVERRFPVCEVAQASPLQDWWPYPTVARFSQYGEHGFAGARANVMRSGSRSLPLSLSSFGRHWPCAR